MLLPRRTVTLLMHLAAFACLALAHTSQAAAQTRSADPLSELAALMPKAPADLTDARTAELIAAAERVEGWAAGFPTAQGAAQAAAVVQGVERLVDVKSYIDRLLDQALALRSAFVSLDDTDERRNQMRNYLRVASALIDCSGRLRYLSFDAIAEADFQLSPRPRDTNLLVESLLARKSSIGAAVLAEALFAEPPEMRLGSRLLGTVNKMRVLELVAATWQTDVLPTLIDFYDIPECSAEEKLMTALVIYHVGLPQDPHPRQDEDLPTPEIIAEELLEMVKAINPSQLGGESNRRRTALIAALEQRASVGLVGGKYRWGNIEFQAGDWLLMRNPSPYNLFTDLAPGLFTHVGVITTEKGSDGRQRMVVVDLPERGTELQATNVDLYLQRTLHYVILRHKDPRVAAKMGDVARSIIGNKTQFDLNFRTDRVAALKGKPLAGQEIHTYCAGLLLLCAQETNVPRGDFFPIPEYPAGGNTVANLEKLGITFGDNFVSPTGPLFSANFQIVGRREPMYDPHREIEEAIYDHFAARLVDQTLTPSPDLFQSLRLKVAEAGQTNPLLARALASAAGVSDKTDLVSAAKAAAVVETLDEIAMQNSAEFRDARNAIRAGTEQDFARNQLTPEQIAAIGKYRQRHTELYQLWAAERITPRQLRLRLVDYYIERGKKDLNARFFGNG